MISISSYHVSLIFAEITVQHKRSASTSVVPMTLPHRSPALHQSPIRKHLLSAATHAFTHIGSTTGFPYPQDSSWIWTAIPVASGTRTGA